MFDEPTMAAKAAAAGLDWDKIKQGLVRFLPVMATVAAMTKTPYDDMAVAFLQQLLNAPAA